MATSVVDGERRFVWGDSATCRLLGTSLERLEASPLDAFIDPEDLKAELLAMHLLERGEASYELEQCWPGPEGDGCRVLVRGSLLRQAGAGHRQASTAWYVRQAIDLTDGAASRSGFRRPPSLADDLGHRVAARDEGADDEAPDLGIPGRKPPPMALGELEIWAEKLARSNRDLSEFAYIAAHDLRAPLTALAGSAELLARRSGTELGDEGQRYLATVLAKVGTMGRMIDDILAYCQAGEIGGGREVVDCNDVVGEVLEYLAPDIVEAQAFVSMEALGKVVGERTQLVQLFQNVISNALKYRRPEARARIDLTTRRDGDHLVFSVADGGIGVPPEKRSDIFRMFHQLQRSASGTGVGLAICKRIVERHGGRIWVDDSPEGGLCVSFSLPAADLAP